MPDVREALGKMRQSGYGDSPEESPEGSRVITLSEEEAKSLAGYGKPGEEVTCTVHGKLEGDHLHVMSVESSQGAEAPANAGDVMSKMMGAGVMGMRPSPS